MILMSRENPTGHKLETLLHEVQEELQIKTQRIVDDPCPASKVIVENNLAIIELLKAAESLQLSSMKALSAIAEDQGPTGKPRIGK